MVAENAVENQEFLAKLKPDVADLVIQALAKFATTGNFADTIEKNVLLLRRVGVKWQWAELTKAAGLFVQTQAANDIGTSVALRILGVLRQEPNSGAAVELKRLSDEGHLFDRLHQAHENNMRHAEAALIAALILNNQKFEKGAVIGNSEAGYQLAVQLEKTLADRPEIEREVDNQFMEFGTLFELVEAAQNNKAIQFLVRKIISGRVRESRIGSLPIEDIISRLNIYLAYLDADQQGAFMRALPRYETFWKKFDGAPLSDNVYRLFKELIELDDELGTKARERLIQRISEFTNEQWKVILSAGNEPLPLMLTTLTMGKDPNLDFGEPLSQALHSVAYKALEGKEFPAGLTKKWFDISEMLDPNAREVFFKDVRDQIVATKKPGTLQIMVGGGARFLREGQFEAKADEAVRNMLNPLLDKKPDGLNWVTLNATEIEPLVAKADKGTQTYIAEKLDGFARESDELIANPVLSLSMF